MVAANQADFFDGSSTPLPVLGGLSDLTAAQQQAKRDESARIQADAAQKAKELAARLKASDAAKAKAISVQQDQAWAAVQKRSGGVLGDLKVIGAGVASGAGTAAKAVGTVAALVPGGQVIGAALVAGGAALSSLSKGDVRGAVVSGVTAAAPAVGSIASAAQPVLDAVKPVAAVARDVAAVAKPAVAAVSSAAAAVKSVAPVAQTIAAGPVLDKLAKGLDVAASSFVPALPSPLVDPGANADGLRVVVDKLIAAKEAGGSVGDAAARVLRETVKLSLPLPGNDPKVRASAQAVARIVGEVNGARQKLKLAPGVQQTYTSAGLKAAAQYMSGTLGIVAPLAPGVTVRSAQPANVFADLPLVSAKADVIRAPAASSAAAAAKPAAAPAAAPATPAPVVESGFVLTADLRILDGTRWTAAAAANAGFLGTLVRISGPLAQRVDLAPRLWVRAS